MIKTTNLVSLEGIYQKQGNTLTKGNLILRICQRNKPTTKKANQFIVSRPKGSKGQYISSLYRVSDKSYNMDFNGKKYLLEFTPDDVQAVIKLR